jgi:hypothetical protein
MTILQHIPWFGSAHSSSAFLMQIQDDHKYLIADFKGKLHFAFG